MGRGLNHHARYTAFGRGGDSRVDRVIGAAFGRVCDRLVGWEALV